MKAGSGVLHGDGPMTAQHESNESKAEQKDDWHVSRLFAFILFQVKLLQTDGTMAKHTERFLITGNVKRYLSLILHLRGPQ